MKNAIIIAFAAYVSEVNALKLRQDCGEETANCLKNLTSLKDFRYLVNNTSTMKSLFSKWYYANHKEEEEDKDDKSESEEEKKSDEDTEEDTNNNDDNLPWVTQKPVGN